MFADDILLYITNTSQTLPKIKALLEEYGTLAGFKINQEKSELLPLQTEKQNKKKISQSIFPMNNNQIKYLGIYIGKTHATIYSLNFPPLISKIENQLKLWKEIPILFGGANLLKVNFHKASLPFAIYSVNDAH